MAEPLPTSVTLQLPQWVTEALGGCPPSRAGTEERMRFVLDLAEGNVRHGTGGPFSSAVFRSDTGELLSVGLNLVVPASVSVAHAEIVAIALAGQAVGHFDLSQAGPVEIYCSTEPCAMCLGAVPWSGVHRVVTSARDEDARAIGFDEGHKPPDWVEALGRIGIALERDVLRPRGVQVLQSYVEAGGAIYNGATVQLAREGD